MEASESVDCAINRKRISKDVLQCLLQRMMPTHIENYKPVDTVLVGVFEREAPPHA